ncbi:MAG: Gfo/Idh/MocA family oxidoreductase, partial [Candidatus Latescibacterota bacterium]
MARSPAKSSIAVALYPHPVDKGPDMFSVGVIGLGMGRAHLQAYSAIPGIHILAIADLDEARLEACRAQFAVPSAHTDYRALLAMDELNLVSVCLPNCLHAPVTLEALAAGKHVLVEKPMALCVSDAEAMAEAALRHRRTLAVSMNYRWSLGPETWYLRNLVARGCLGTLYYVRAVSLRRRTFMPGYLTWFTDRRRSGGGGLIDMGLLHASRPEHHAPGHAGRRHPRPGRPPGPAPLPVRRRPGHVDRSPSRRHPLARGLRGLSAG